MTRSVSLVTLAALLWSTTGTAAFYLAGSLSPFAIGAITFGAGGVVLAVLEAAARSLWCWIERLGPGH